MAPLNGKARLSYAAMSLPHSATTLPDAIDPARFGGDIALLALLASEPTLSVPPGLAFDADALSAHGPTSQESTAQESFAGAWAALGAPSRVLVRSGPADAPAGPNTPPAPETRIRTAAAFAAAVADAAVPDAPLLVLADHPHEVRGVAYSEDPREDRSDEIHIDAWASTTPTGAAVRYRRPRQTGPDGPAPNDGDRWHTTIGQGAFPVLPSHALASIERALRTAERVLGDAIALEWRWSSANGLTSASLASTSLTSTGLTIVGVEPQRAPMPWAVYREPPQPHDGWSRANAGEVLAAPVTPLTWDMMNEPLNSGFAAMYPPGWSQGRRFFALFNSYAYFNLGLVYHLVVEPMGGPARAMLDVVGGPGDPQSLGVPDRGLRWRTILRSLPTIIRSTASQGGIPNRWLWEERQLEALRAEITSVDPASVDSRTIMIALDHIYERQLPHVRFFMEAQGAAFSNYAMLRHVLDWFLSDPALANRLVQGLPEVSTAALNLRLWRLGQRAAAQATVAAIVRDTPPASLRDTLRATPDAVWLANELDDFLRDHAHRGAAELELMSPRWGDDPTPILTSFRSYVTNPQATSMHALAQRQQDDREAAQREVDARLRQRWWERLLPLRRSVVRHYARLAQRYAPLRENPKAAVLAVAYETRTLVLVLGERLTAVGVLADPNDVFFLDRQELSQLVVAAESEAAESEDRDADAVSIGRLRRRIWRRRRFYEQALETEPPPFAGESPAQTNAADPQAAPATPKGASQGPLHGLAAPAGVAKGLPASAGVAEGLARVLNSPADGARLGPGEILVARFTDPGWTHLFLIAGAVVTEIGGVLSHGAIVAREYGLPAVVNVPGATSIPDGAHIRVDGSAGSVERLP